MNADSQGVDERSRPVLIRAIVAYAGRLHAAVRSGHAVASPLGAWLVLALAASAAPEHDDRLPRVLGMPPAEAATAAETLLMQPHPLIATAAAVWHREEAATPRMRGWLDSLDGCVDRGPMPSQAEADRWAEEKTLGLIRRLPLDLGEGFNLLLVSALATKISWEFPFRSVDVDVLGAHRWGSGLRRVLRAPSPSPHRQFIARTVSAGDVAVHIAGTRDGLLVASVIADSSVTASEVLTAAVNIAVQAADGHGSDLGRVSLFDLPLGETPRWTIREEPVETTVADGREEEYDTVLPAWSALSQHDLSLPGLGFDEAADVLRRSFDLSGGPFAARQAAVARYSRTGFEAAAVTGLGFAVSRPMRRSGQRRTAEIRFVHPYAVVAVATNPRDASGTLKSSPWTGLPVFSAWVGKAENAD